MTKRSFRRYFLPAAAAAALSLLPAAASAWMFSGDVLIHKVGVARRTMKNGEVKVSSLEVKGRMTLAGSDAKKAADALGIKLKEGETELTLMATASYKIPGRCLLELQQTPDGQRLTTKDEQKPESLQMFADIVCPLLDGRGGYEGPFSLIKASGIRRWTVTLGRVEKQAIAYVVGGTPAQRDKSSFWVAKDIFQPVRFIDRSNGGDREVRLIDYGTEETGRWHPKKIELHSGGKRIGLFVAEKISPNVKLHDAIF